MIRFVTVVTTGFHPEHIRLHYEERLPLPRFLTSAQKGIMLISDLHSLSLVVLINVMPIAAKLW